MNIWKSLHEFIAELMGIELYEDVSVNNPCGVDS
jgi:hypothetical protein